MPLPRSFADKVQDHISKGWGIEAIKLGTRWDLIRLQPTTGYTTIAVNRFFRVNQWLSHKEIEFAEGSFVYRTRGDRRILKINDQLLGKESAGPQTDPTLQERYTIVAMRIVQENIAVRTDEACQLYRPTQYTPLGVSAPSYNLETVKNAQIAYFDLVAGTWQFGTQGALPVGAITTIYVGFTLAGGGHFDPGHNLPYATPETGWLASLQLLDNIVIQPGDIFVDPMQQWYRCDRPYLEFEAAFLNQVWTTRVRR